MRGAGTEFSRINNAVKIFKESVSNALRTYTEKAEAVKRQAEAYKDEKAYIDANLAPLKEDARRAIKSARKDFNKRLEDEKNALEKLLYEKVSVLPDRAFSDLLRFYRDFDIAPNRMEVAGLLEASGGNFLAIRAMNKYFEKAGVKYRIAATSYDDFAEDLNRIKKLEQVFWTGNDYPVAAAEIYNGTPRATYDEEGREVQRGYMWDGISRAMENAMFSEHTRALEKASEAWVSEVLPRITEDEDGKPKEVPHELPPVEEVKDSAEAFAKRSGAERASADAKAREAVRMYSPH